MPHDVHNTAQTAFRFPEAVLARLKGTAGRRGETMTDIVVRGTVAELDRLDRITTDTPPAGPVSPSPRRSRKPRADTAPAAREPESASDIVAAIRRRRNGGK